MSQKPIVHLVIPQLIQPLNEWESSYGYSPSYLFLTKFLSNYRLSKRSEVYGVNETLFAKLGLSEGCELPIAKYRHQYQTDNSQISDLSLVCADPINLEVGLNDITLSHQINDLTESESKALIILLNSHFEQDGLEFLYGSKNEWYVSLENEGFISHPLENVLGKNIANYLPKSNNRNWDVIQNEVQMILHSSPVNHQREMMGLPSVNSLWFWGGGQKLSVAENKYQIFSDDEQRGRMISNVSGGGWSNIFNKPDLMVGLQNDSIILYEALTNPAKSNDVELYQSKLKMLEDEVIEPIFEAWEQDEIELTIDSCNGFLIKPIRTPTWKFWKKPPTSLLGIIE